MDETRTFTDPEGVRWTVTEILPQVNVAPAVERRKLPRMPRRVAPANAHFPARDPLLASLSFDSRTDSRTFSPAPEGWRTLPDTGLQELLGRSQRVTG